MPSALVSTEIAVGTLLALVVVGLALVYLRRRYIARGLPLTLCGLRDAGRDRWRLGLIRFGDNTLEWYSLGGVSVRPGRTWQRQGLLLDAPDRLEGSQGITVLPDAFRVPCTEGGDHFELALQGPDYTALRSWQEAAPPGYNVNVA